MTMLVSYYNSDKQQTVLKFQENLQSCNRAEPGPSLKFRDRKGSER